MVVSFSAEKKQKINVYKSVKKNGNLVVTVFADASHFHSKHQ